MVNDVNHQPSPGQRVLSIGPILDNIFSYSTPATILCASRTMRMAHDIARSYLNLAYNVDRFLFAYFSSPDALRALQARTGTLLAGQPVLDFLQRTDMALEDTTSVSPNLVLLVYGAYFFEAARFLVSNGYSTSDALSPLLPREVSQWARHDSVHTISLRIVRQAPVVTLLMSDCMCSMNAIAFNKVFSLYPHAAFEPSHQCSKPKPANMPVSERIEPPGALSRTHHPYRFVGDKHTWMMPIDARSITLPSPASNTSRLSGDAMEWCSWRRPSSEKDAWLANVVYDSSLLRFRYALYDNSLLHAAEQLLARFVIGNPERARAFHDAELIQFLKLCFAKWDLTAGPIPYSMMWPIIKSMSPLPSEQ
ncbi:hypothetical protein FA95DRAFT_1675295 [Auriscalpium vulgare]|uniref:Uncharacterized protein n=1 Tax=Auriscalpium vulgare TaxID=40419 RepID=A0ACB8S6V4_9AGAM|nr:hypothetical protein FA95DRAFT_1675295 [Auriscalpium vulgare]